MSKDRITRGLVTGEAQRSVCGEEFVPESMGGGSVSDAQAIICPFCEGIDQVVTEANAKLREIRSLAAMSRDLEGVTA